MTETNSAKMQYQVKVLNPAELSEKDIDDWFALAENSIEPNAYLSPNFVLPALKHIEKDSKVSFLAVYNHITSKSNLVGLFIFKKKNFSYKFPLPHYYAFHTKHSYLSGILVDKDHAKVVVQLILEEITKSQKSIAIDEYPADGILYTLIEDIMANLGYEWFTFKKWDRKTLLIGKVKETLSSHSKRLVKNFKRHINGLKEIGELEWQLFSQGNVNPTHINDFLRLENMGWKGKEKSSLYSSPQETAFFKEMIQNFNKKEQAFFMELRLNNQTISSTSNFISGNAGFAFKIGWDTAYAKYSPGVLNEILFLQLIDDKFNKIEFVDSGTAEASYIDKIWSDSRKIHSGIYIHKNLGMFIIPILRYGILPISTFIKEIKKKILLF